MAGGSLTRLNKIGCGYAAAVRSTRVDHVGRGSWRNFGAGDLPIGLDQAGNQEMAGNCGFLSGAGGVVARIASHGAPKPQGNQRLGLSCRLIGGLTARPSARSRAAARRVGRTGAASPFRPAPGATRVASASRQIQRFSAQGRPDLCLKLRSGQGIDARIIGSGFGQFLSIPTNGVGGPSLDGAGNGSAGRVNGADGEGLGDFVHQAGAPFVERARKATPPTKTVNEPSQKSVDNGK